MSKLRFWGAYVIHPRPIQAVSDRKDSNPSLFDQLAGPLFSLYILMQAIISYLILIKHASYVIMKLL